MKKYKKSDLIVPISIVLQLGMINGILYVLTPDTYLHPFHILFLNISFLIITLGLRYYTIERKEQFVTRLNVMVQIFFTYGLVYFAMFSITETQLGSLKYQLFVYAIVCLALAWYRVMFFWIRRTYRKVGGNSVSVVVVGRDMNLKKIRSVFDDPGLGYRY